LAKKRSERLPLFYAAKWLVNQNTILLGRIAYLNPPRHGSKIPPCILRDTGCVGDSAFANQMKEANLKVMKFVETLSVCTSERPDLAKIMEDAITQTAQRMAGASCTPDLRALLVQRRPEFEGIISFANRPDTMSALFAKLGVTVDADGNVRACRTCTGGP
jgi:hypothetical protein